MNYPIARSPIGQLYYMESTLFQHLPCMMTDSKPTLLMVQIYDKLGKRVYVKRR